MVLLQGEVLDLAFEIQRLRTRLLVTAGMVRRAGFYWRGLDGPFCVRCWDTEGVLGRMFWEAHGQRQCHECHVLASDLMGEALSSGRRRTG